MPEVHDGVAALGRGTPSRTGIGKQLRQQWSRHLRLGSAPLAPLGDQLAHGESTGYDVG